MKQQAKNPFEQHLQATARVFRMRSVVLLLEREAKSDENVYRNTRGEATSDNNEKNKSSFSSENNQGKTHACILILGVNFLPVGQPLSNKLPTLGCPAPPRKLEVGGHRVC